MTPETLYTSEKPKIVPNEPPAQFSDLDEAQIEALMLSRKGLLESLKAKVSLKAYYTMEEKTNSEEKRLNEILDLKRGKQSRMAKYSLILNPNYFEQEFLSS